MGQNMVVNNDQRKEKGVRQQLIARVKTKCVPNYFNIDHLLDRLCVSSSDDAQLPGGRRFLQTCLRGQ